MITLLTKIPQYLEANLFRFCRVTPFTRGYHGDGSRKWPTNDSVIDLRSDTVTKPSKGMLEAMFNAEIGDDVFKEDPSVNKLEKICAELFGMEKALYVPSGTMGNLLCLMTHLPSRGEELIIGDGQHIYRFEQGNFMQLASISVKVLSAEHDGTLCLHKIRNSISDNSDFHCCESKLICLENTHMNAGGLPLPIEYLKQVKEIAEEKHVKVHIDGARVYNAAVASNCDLKHILRHTDSVSMCLSKGLGCPVGSVIGGSEDFINKAMRWRKPLGGGLRQAGFLAAAGLYALEHARDTLTADHNNANRLARGIKDLNCKEIIDINLDKVKTNILMAKTEKFNATDLVRDFREKGLLALAFDDSTIRFVTHLDVNEKGIDDALIIIEDVTKNYI